MFKSFKHLNPGAASEGYVFEIIDEDFICGVEDKSSAGIWTAIIKQYSKRKLDVGFNLALATIWYSEDAKINIDELINFQNMHCPKYVENWSKISKHRDEYLKKWMTWR